MAAASPSNPSPCAAWLNEHQISELSGCVSRILEDVWPRLQSDTDASDAIFAVKSAVQFACAQFASSFNDRNPHAVTSRLPVELLTACLYAADMQTRIRTSHVSLALRALALAERGLWTEYSRTSLPWAGKGLRSSLDFLEAIVRRSDPLPLRLKLQHYYCGANDPFASEAAAIITPHLDRLQEYDGSDYVFHRLNPDEVPMHALVSLNWIGDLSGDLSCLGTITSVMGPERPQWLPNLRRLVAPVIDFQGHCYSNLRDIVCAVSGEESENLFRHCPNLVRAEFYGWQCDGHLPCGPVPRTIQEIALHGEVLGDRDPDGIDFAALRTWAGEQIPQLTLLGAHSLDTIVRELRAAHTEPTSLTVAASGDDPDIVLANAEEPSRWCWAIKTRYFWGSPHCTDDLQQLFAAVQITTLSITKDMLDTLLSARIDAPHLLSLELRLTGDASAAPSECQCLRAPDLQHFVLDLGTTNAVTRVDEINDALDGLARNFRRLIVYDAELLETVTVRSSARTTAEADCAPLAHFARRYVELMHR